MATKPPTSGIYLAMNFPLWDTWRQFSQVIPASSFGPFGHVHVIRKNKKSHLIFQNDETHRPVWDVGSWIGLWI